MFLKVSTSKEVPGSSLFIRLRNVSVSLFVLSLIVVALIGVGYVVQSFIDLSGTKFGLDVQSVELSGGALVKLFMAGFLSVSVTVMAPFVAYMVFYIMNLWGESILDSALKNRKEVTTLED